MRWIDAPPPPHAPLPGYPPLLGRLLARRGLTTPAAAAAFLDPHAYTPTPPEALPSLPAALRRLQQALRRGEPICIWGDFDVDGQTATAILVQALRSLGAPVTYHLAVRSREGHSLLLPRLEEKLHQGVKLLITCDIGINEHAAIVSALQQGVDVLILDHHEPPPNLPPAQAIISPHFLPADHPLAPLSSAGLAYKLAEALLMAEQAPLAPQALLDLTALGLIADLAPLRGEARYLVQRGLAILRTTPRRGLQILYELAEIEPGLLTESQVAFSLASRLNAFGRLLDANPLVEFLLTEDAVRAGMLATQIENAYAQYQLLTNQVLQAAEEQIQRQPELARAPLLFLEHPNWSGAVINVVAARLAERYGKPAFVLVTPPKGPARGSARSVEGINIMHALAATADLLIKFGGHAMAAGFSLPAENLPTFRRRLTRAIRQITSAHPAEATLEIEAHLTLADLTPNLAADLERLAPFGPGNPRPIFVTHRLTLESSASLGRNREHRKLTLAEENGQTQTAFWWNSGHTPLPEGPFDLAYTLRLGQKRGLPQVYLEVIDLHPTAEQTSAPISGRPQVTDWRQEPDPYRLLPTWQADPETLLWAEGEEKEQVGGSDRNALRRAHHLVVWTVPPAGEVWRAALEVVQPKHVTLVCIHPSAETTEDFIARLSGLLKYVLHQRGGQTSYAQLAAATAQRLETVRAGLAWLTAQGKIILRRDENGNLSLAAGSDTPTLPSARRLWVEVQTLLAETAAYRSYFRRAPVEALFSEQ